LSKNAPLSDRVRERLLSRVEAMHRVGKPRVDDKGAARDAHERLTDFSTLPGYAELQLQRSIGENLGLANPYFRMHDGLASSHTEIAGRRLLNFSCYDYLGLNGHPEIVAAAKAAIDRYGISCSASRHVAGERPVHRQLEDALADHYNCEEALIFVSGYATNLGVIGQLVGPKDLVVSDEVIHNSAVLGGVLSGAVRRCFAHNDLDNLDQLLTAMRSKFERVLIVVEGLYSMDGDFPDLRRLVEIKQRHHAWLMVDEAHSLGVLGQRGYGLWEHFNVDPREVDIWMGTLSKTLAGCGGYIAGTGKLVDYLRCMVGTFVYSVGMPPVIAASVHKALEIMHREPSRVAKLQHNAAYFLSCVKKHGLDSGNGGGTAVCPIVVGDSIPAVVLSQQLFHRGINVQPVLYPAVPARSSRLRFFLTAMHTEEEIDETIEAIVEEMAQMPETVRNLKFQGYPG
jgi:8-amino-7-oxononanoate synthase